MIADLTDTGEKRDNAYRRSLLHALVDSLLDEFEQKKLFGHVAIKMHIQSGVFAHVEDETKRVHK